MVNTCSHEPRDAVVAQLGREDGAGCRALFPPATLRSTSTTFSPGREPPPRLRLVRYC